MGNPMFLGKEILSVFRYFWNNSYYVIDTLHTGNDSDTFQQRRQEQE